MNKPNLCTTLARSWMDESNSKSALLRSSEEDQHAVADACHGQQLQVQSHTRTALPHQRGQAGKAAQGLTHLPLCNKGNWSCMKPHKCAALEQDSVLNLSLFPNYLYKNKSKVNVPCDSSATALQLSKPPASLHQTLKQELASLAASTIRRWPRKKELQSASIQNGHVDMAVFCWFLCTFSLFFAYCLVNF